MAVGWDRAQKRYPACEPPPPSHTSTLLQSGRSHTAPTAIILVDQSFYYEPLHAMGKTTHTCTTGAQHRTERER